jgi:hypothetical protein
MNTILAILLVIISLVVIAGLVFLLGLIPTQRVITEDNTTNITNTSTYYGECQNNKDCHDKYYDCKFQCQVQQDSGNTKCVTYDYFPFQGRWPDCFASSE